MAFGLAVLDDQGRVWTVDVKRCPVTHTTLGLHFSRPSFIEPLEQRYLANVPECWPSCDGEQLRAALRLAVPHEPQK